MKSTKVNRFARGVRVGMVLGHIDAASHSIGLALGFCDQENARVRAELEAMRGRLAGLTGIAWAEQEKERKRS